MKCPLLQAGWLMKDNVGTSSEADCLKEECAWWDREAQECALLSIGARLGTLCDAAYELIEKMPEED